MQNQPCDTQAASAPAPNGYSSGYDVILVDVPWSYRDKCNDGKRGADHKYDTMSIEEAASMPVGEVAAKDSTLFMWVTAPFMVEGFQLIKHWGFKYKTVAFCWVKHTKNRKLHYGMGHWTRANAEYVLLGVKGKPKRQDAGVHQIVTSTIGVHSAKPDEVSKRIERLMGPDTRKLELFARRQRDGWDCIGNQLNGIDVHEYLRIMKAMRCTD